MSSNAIQLALARLPWVLRIFSIGAFALVGASIVNLFVAQAIRPVPKFTPVAAQAPKAVHRADLEADSFARMMGMQLPAPAPSAEDEAEAVDGKPAGPKPDDLTSEPVRSSLHAQLLATVVANKPEWSIATLRDLNQNQDDVYMIDDLFMGAKVLTIDQLRVVILNDGHREFLDLTPPNAAGPAAPKPVADAAPAGGQVDGIKKIDERHFQIERSTVNNALGNLNDLAMQARIVPSFKNGQANGFKLFSIKPDSLYSQIGIQNGDVIQRINGLDINSPDKALEAYGKLKSANALDLSVERNGQTVSYHYAIQ